jgi:hypothetical protein
MEGLEQARYHDYALYLDCTLMFYWITDQTGSVEGGGHAKVKDVFTDHHFFTPPQRNVTSALSFLV